MSLIDPRDTRITISSDWSPTVEEIMQLCDAKGCTKVIDELLQAESIQEYFRYHLVDNLSVYTDKKEKLPKETQKDVDWLLNQDALWRDVKVNVVIRALRLHEIADMKEACKQQLNENMIKDVIYWQEEAIDDVFNEVCQNSAVIRWQRIHDEKEENTFRRRIVLIGEE